MDPLTVGGTLRGVAETVHAPTYPAHPIFRWDGPSPLAGMVALMDVMEQIDAARWKAFRDAMPETDEDRRARLLRLATPADEPDAGPDPYVVHGDPGA